VKEDKEIQILSNVNNLLNEFNNTFSDSDKDIKKMIAETYISINSPESIKEEYNAIPMSLGMLNDYLEKKAVAEKYPFTQKQNDIIHEYNNVYSVSFLQSLGALINGPAFFHP